MSLGWDAAVDSSDVSYRVYMREDGGVFNFSKPCLITSDTFCTVEGLDVGETYFFVVRAVDDSGNMDDNLVELSAVPFDLEPPMFDGIGFAGDLAGGGVFVEWDEAIDPSEPIMYNVYLSTDSGSYNWEEPSTSTYENWIILNDSIFDDRGLHYIVVRAMDVFGNMDDNIVEWSVYGLNEHPFADFSYLPVDPLPFENISFVDGSFDNDGVIVNWSWDFGDGNISYLQNPIHQYISPGNYTVCLTVIDDDGGEGNKIKTIVVLPNQPPYIPNSPDPYDGETDVGVDHDLSWTGGDPDGDSVTYDVYFDTTSPPSQVVWGQIETTYDPGTMNPNTQYFWQIVSWDNHGASTAGPIWEFTTENNPPYVPSNPNPTDGATDVDIDADVSWTCSDPDGDSLTYDVYFEADDSTPDVLVSDDQTETTFDPGTLDYETTYYWQIIAEDEYGAVTDGPIWSFTTEDEPPKIPDLDCSGTLSWTGITPGSTVTGSFTVENIGDIDSLLDWEVDSYPDWGTWTFDPDGGDDLLAGETEIIDVEVVAPDEPETEFTGEVKIVNSENVSDFCIIDVSLATPVNQFQSTQQIPRFLQSIIERYPVMRQLLGL